MSGDFRVILNDAVERGTCATKKSITKTIYSLIYEKCYEEAINVLESLKNASERIRVQVLLAYCHYQLKDYEKSTEIYKKLLEINNCSELFRTTIQLVYAQTLYQLGDYRQVEQVLEQMVLSTSHNFDTQIMELKVAILYNKCEFKEAKQLLEKCPASLAMQNSLACILYKENDPKQARQIWSDLQKQLVDFSGQLAYNQALCEYKLRNYDRSLQSIDKIIESATSTYPELKTGTDSDDCPSSCFEIESIGNCSCLIATALIETFNLKAAIYFMQNQSNEAKKVLALMPPRSEPELDAVTLHNLAIANTEQSVENSFEKLLFLLEQQSSLNDSNTNDIQALTFRNLLLLCCCGGEPDRAETILTTYSTLIYKCLKPAFYELLEALLLMRKNEEEKAFAKLDELLKYNYEHARKLYKEQKELLKDQNSSFATIKSIYEFKDFIQDLLLPTVMAQAEIFWQRNDYSAVEKLLKKSAEFCSKNVTWNLNYAHVLFAQRKFQQAAQLYKSLMEPDEKQLLNVNPVILANLCVCYIMTSQNTEASSLIKQIHEDEELQAMETDEQLSNHSAIVNLTIGMLYCTKNNYEFGITRVLSALEPIANKLNPIVWTYVKISFIGLLLNMARGQVILSDTLAKNCFDFFDNCSQYGLVKGEIDAAFKTIYAESRMLKYQLLELI